MIPEWLSFWNEFISSSISLYLFTWYRTSTSHSGMSLFRFSFRMKFSFWYEISFWYYVNWKRTSFRIENRKLFSLERVAHAYLIWRENHPSENALGGTVRFYHVNAGRMKLITVSCKQVKRVLAKFHLFLSILLRIICSVYGFWLKAFLEVRDKNDEGPWQCWLKTGIFILVLVLLIRQV